MYTFSTINDKEFEELVRDLLSKEHKKRFQIFKKGKDGGIDLRFSSNSKTNSIIVQAKHYIDSKYSDLVKVLKKEVTKVNNLNPDRYILVTSIKLLPQNKDEIKNIFEPFIKSTQDIYGCEDLNCLLKNFKEIETKHYKLWLSSTNVLQNILKNAVLGRSEFSKNQIEKKTKVFVPCKTFNKAVDLLNKNNFLLITGEPGIGKTMLANMLSINLLEKKYELITVYDIKEAEDIFDISKKQVFYFDDFLGANYYDIAIAKNRDSALVNFVERIINSTNKKLILTTRTVILNKAKKESEKIDNSEIEMSKYELKIEDYNRLQKAKILYNHIFFSKLNWDIKNVFFENKFYNKVINHRNYSPRIIEHFTDIKKIKKELGDILINQEYENLVLDKLDKPEEVWRKSFENQISDSSKYLLISLFTSQSQLESTIKEIFNSRIEYEIKKGLKKEFNQFGNSLKELLDGFVTRKHNIYDNFEYYSISFYNPSLGDFLINYIANMLGEEIRNILESAVYIEQFTYRFTTKKEKEKGKIFVNKNLIESIFTKKFQNLKSIFYQKEITLKIIGIISFVNLFGFKNNNQFIISNLNDISTKINQNEISDLDIYKSIEFFEILVKNELLKTHKKICKVLLINMSKKMKSLSDFDILKNQIKIIEISILEEFLEDVDFVNELEENINNVFNYDFDKFLVEFLSDKELVEKDQLINLFEHEKSKIISYSASLNIAIPEVAYKDLEDLVDINELLYQNRKRDIEDDEISFDDFEKRMQNEEEETFLIDELFEKPL